MDVGNYLPPKDEVYPGNYWPIYNNRDIAVYQMVAVDQDYDYQDDEGQPLDQETIQDNQWNWEQSLMSMIGETLGKKFFKVQNEWSWESGTVRVHMLTWETDYPLVVTPLNPLGLQHYRQVARRLFDTLLEYDYKLSVRCGPWTSRPYEKGE